MTANANNARKFVSMDIGEAHALLDRVDREQRRQWLLSLATMIVMATALLSIWVVASAKTGFPISRLALVVVLYLVLVATFARSSRRRQQKLARQRREAASQLGVIAAHETLNLILGKSAKAEAERRRLQRAICDQPLTVTAGGTTYYGRVSDVCEHGVGAIIPAALEIGTHLALEFPLGSQALHVNATVRQRNGVRYGFEFVQLGQAECEAIEKFRAGTAETHSEAKSAGANEA